MKVKENFLLRHVADSWMIIPIGQEMVDFNGMLTLNESGALLWKALEQGGDRDTLADVLCAEYEVARTEALADVDVFLGKLTEVGCLEA